LLLVLLRHLCSLSLTFLLSLRFLFTDSPPTVIYTLSLHDALPISPTAVHHPSVIPYRLSFRYSVDGSIPSTSAARALLPPSACSTHRMYARSMSSSVGFVCGRSETRGADSGFVMRDGSASTSTASPFDRIAARSSAFSSSRTLPGHSYACSADSASGVSVR